MGVLTYSEIVKLKSSIDNNRSNFTANVNSISTDMRSITFDGWNDAVSDKFSDYIDYLSSGVVSKLNDSIGVNGSLRKLKELVDSLYNQCSKYISNFETCKTRYGDLAFNASNSIYFVDTSVEDEELITNLNRDFGSQRDIISNTLSELRKLKFDTIVDFETSYVTIPDIDNYQMASAVVEPVTINQFDLVKVYIEGEGLKEMYYLGTNYKGISYFSESLDDNAIAYSTVVPGSASTSRSWLTDTSTLAMPGGADAYFAFVISGGNTGKITKGNVLKKIGKSYANGQYVGSWKFNESICFENGAIAPEIVSRSGRTTDPSITYYAVDFENLETVSLRSIVNSEEGFNTSEHPAIKLEAGEKITTSYHFFLWMYDNYSIGNSDKPVILIWDDNAKAYYVAGENGYSTNVEFEGIDYVTIDKLNESRTKFVTK